MKITPKHSPLLLTVFLVCSSAVAFAQAQADYSNTRVKNATGLPLPLMDIQGGGGKKVATLYITGKEATFGPNQVMIRGSGYVEALPGESVSLIAIFRYKYVGETEINYEEFGIKVSRVDWDDNGTTTQISGISPLAQTMHGNLKIISDVANPTLTTNGALVLNVEKLGKVSVDFRFGGFGGRCAAPLGCAGMFVGDPVLEFPNKVDQRSAAVNSAAKEGDLEKVKALLEENPDLVFSKDKHGDTPLINALEYGQKAAWVTTMSRLLISKKADVNAKGSSGLTPLHWAASGLKDVVALLLANNADVNAKDDYGRTPLHQAATFGQKDVAELLLANRADVNAKTADGQTPLHCAATRGHNDVAELLRQHGGHE